jgi:ferredoxin
MAYKVTVIQEECIGCGACPAVCDNFAMVGDKAKEKKQEIADEELEKNREAADSCPQSCIKIEKIE